MISIFSKFVIPGGSERRCLELVNGLVKYFDEKVNLLCRDKNFPDILKKELDSRVNLVTDCMSQPEYFYNSDYILVVNSDSRNFTKIENWTANLDMNKMSGKTIIFLFNFIVSPSQELFNFEKFGIKLGIITTNTKFFKEISEKDKFSKVSHLPRFCLQSPVESEKLVLSKNQDPSKFIITFLSKSYEDKWNDDISILIENLNKLNTDQKSFYFKLMGAKRSLAEKLKHHKNVSLLKENSLPLKEFFKDADAFIFFPSYKRQEPWARVIGEAMTCGLPILALDNSGGTREQIIHGNNGFLCKNISEFEDKCVYLFTNQTLAQKMGRNSNIYSSDFSSKSICAKLLNIFKEVGRFI